MKVCDVAKRNGQRSKSKEEEKANLAHKSASVCINILMVKGITITHLYNRRYSIYEWIVSTIASIVNREQVYNHLGPIYL